VQAPRRLLEVAPVTLDQRPATRFLGRAGRPGVRSGRQLEADRQVPLGFAPSDRAA
jgi:hypothetical protein